MKLPLAGVRIVSIEQYGAGPFGTQHLSDLGAEVIKVENSKTGGDVGRSVGPYFFSDGDSHFYQSFNRNKKSIDLDLKTDAGKQSFHELVKVSDAVFHNLRGDIPEKLGLTFDHLKQYNNKIVCAHLTAYGRFGSRKNWPGYDYLMQAEAGYLSLTGEPGGPPARFGISIIDMMTGTMSALALVSAVLSAREIGQGRDVDVSLYDVAMHNLSYLGTWYLNEGFVAERSPRSSHPSLTPSQLYRTKDGWIFIMCNKEKFWPILANEIGKPEWSSDPLFCNFQMRLKNRDLLTAKLDEVFSELTTPEWMSRLGGKVPCAPVNNVAEALDGDFALEVGAAVSSEHPSRGEIKTLACPIRLHGQKLPLNRAPELGENTEEVLKLIGENKISIYN